jgi:hypothetical protein
MTTTQKQPRIAVLGGREVRTFATTLQARDLGGLEFKVAGYASVVEQPYEMGGYSESIGAEPSPRHSPAGPT